MNKSTISREHKKNSQYHHKTYTTQKIKIELVSINIPRYKTKTVAIKMRIYIFSTTY
jgi:hypothetical protein